MCNGVYNYVYCFSHVRNMQYAVIHHSGDIKMSVATWKPKLVATPGDQLKWLISHPGCFECMKRHGKSSYFHFTLTRIEVFCEVTLWKPRKRFHAMFLNTPYNGNLAHLLCFNTFQGTCNPNLPLHLWYTFRTKNLGLIWNYNIILHIPVI